MRNIALVAVFEEGLLDSFAVFSSTRKARKRYGEVLKEYDLTEESNGKNGCTILCEPGIAVQ